MDDVLIRPYRATTDREAVLALAPRLAEGVAPWRDSAAVADAVRGWVVEAVDAAPDSTDERVWVAEAAGAVVGFVHAAERAHFTGARDGYVGELAVAEPAQGRGVGRALLRAAERWAAERGLARLSLETGAANTAARAFYRALGYQEEDVRLSRAVGEGVA